MSQHSTPSTKQEISLDDLSGIEIRASRLDLVVEEDAELDGVAQLLSEPDSSAPTLAIQGSRLVVEQDGRYRGTATPVLKLPAIELPPIAANISRGNLTFESIFATLAINIDSGNLRVSGGQGDVAVNVSSGNVTIRQREGDIACQVDSGQFALTGCNGEIAVNISKGAVDLYDCLGGLTLRMDKGDVSVTRPVEQSLRIALTKGNVRIHSGSLTSSDIEVTRGDIYSNSQLLFSELAEPPEDLEDDIDEIEEAVEALDEAVEALDEEVRFNLGSVEFIAGEAGVRISTGGTERFVAGPEGVQVRRADGTPVFSASESGFKVGPSTRRRGREHFRFRTNRGSIALDVAEEQPARVELIVNRGDVQSDIPLVEVGRPGPRSSTRRYVGASDRSETERILIRAMTNRGDIRVRTAKSPPEPAQPGGISNRERQRRQILEALSQGRITADEADILLAAMERESG